MNSEQETQNGEQSQEKEVRREGAIRKSMLKKVIGWVLLVGGLAGLIYWSSVASEKQEAERFGEDVAVLESPHVQLGSLIDSYNSNPPTSGPHYPEPANWGVYQEELVDGQAVHNLEHGGIWISYRPDIDDASKEILEEIGKRNSGSVIVSPRASNDSLIALTSWGRIEKMDAVDEEFINNYILSNKNKSPEQFAR